MSNNVPEALGNSPSNGEPWINKLFSHLKTIHTHRKFVRQHCFKMGLYWQGLTHDLSKYSPEEFWVSVSHYQGFRSPNVGERKEYGYSKAWLHHCGRNKHHFEYWQDYTGKVRGQRLPVKMPLKYAAEMIADRCAASKTYNKDEYDQSFPLKYFMGGKDNLAMHEETKAFTEKVLTIMAEKGEDEAFKYVKNLLKKNEEY